MRINGLNIVAVVVVIYNVCFCASKSNTASEQIQISSRKEDVRPDSIKILYHGLKNKRHEPFNSKLLATNNDHKLVIKRDENHKDNVKRLVGQHKVKETPVERKKRKHKKKRKHYRGTQKESYKTRTRKWDDILLKSKKGRTSKHSYKVINEDTDYLKNDKTLHANNRGKATKNKQASDRSDRRKDSSKNRNEKTASDDEKTVSNLNKKLHDRVSDEPTKSKAGDKSDKIKDNRKHRKYSDDDVSKFLNETQLKSLRDALLVHPFNIWKFKDRFKSMADLGIHEALLQDVVENKWNTRLKHKLFKVFKGENIHMAVIGGSNTAGGGIQVDEGRTDGLFFRVILDWWQKTITPLTGSHLKTRQIAMGGTSSDFFQYCHRSYVQKDVDLVLLEMSVNDLHELPYKVNLSLPIEQLTRQLLEYPTEPALIYVNLLSGRAYYQGCTNLEDFGQRLLSDAYEITTFNWRDAVCPVIDGKYRIPLKGCSVICKDGHHINQLGHAHISLMVINLFRDLLLDNIGHVDELSREVFHDEVILPKPVFIAGENKIIADPVCWTTVTPNFKRKIITNSMEVGVMENYGFDYIHDKAIGGGHCFTKEACRADAYSGWTGKDVGASLTLAFTVPPLGHKRRIQSRSVVLATRTCWKCGVAEVWLDDDVVNRRQIRAQSQYSQTLLEIIALRVNPGDHTMSVKVVHPGFVTVVGVMLGPPDGPY